MTRIVVEVDADLDDCDRATLQGIVGRAVANSPALSAFLEFRAIDEVKVSDPDPRTMRVDLAPATVYTW